MTCALGRLCAPLCVLVDVAHSGVIPWITTDVPHGVWALRYVALCAAEHKHSMMLPVLGLAGRGQACSSYRWASA